MTSMRTGAVLAVALLLTGSTAWAGEDESGEVDLSLRWELEVDRGTDEFANNVAADGHQVFTVGAAGSVDCLLDTVFPDCRALVRADSAKTGAGVWNLNVPGTADSVALHGNLVLVAGAGIDDTGARDFRVWAVQQGTGQIVWQNGSRPAGALAAEAFKVTAAGNQVFAAGHVVTGPAFPATEFLVRAYDLNTGVMQWEDRSPAGAFLDRLFHVAVHGNHVVATGGRRFNFLVRVYDRDTGALSWQDSVNSFMGFDEAKQAAIHGDRVFVAGELASARGASRNFFVRAYDLVTGTVLWSNETDTGGFDFLTHAAATGDKVFVAGIGGAACGFFAPGDCEWFVRAHDAATGALVWEDRFNSEADHDQPISFGADHGRVYAVGQGGQACPFACDIVIRIHDASTGRLLAFQRFDRHGGDDTLPVMAVHGQTLAVAGSSQSTAGDYDMFIRAYDMPLP